ncbi:hypothetical protein [Aquipuribacter sp. SD81]|uniref:hypothetical protein n=1 Tax=Aquipuribacter sp. SD81 TaxID=3127703 RepID=UPI00301623A1
MAWPGAVPVLLTGAAFALGLLVGWLWWGRQFVRARLTREEALAIMSDRLERELAATDAHLPRLLGGTAGGSADGPGDGSGESAADWAGRRPARTPPDA